MEHMPHEPTYGEIAYRVYYRLNSQVPQPWDDVTERTRAIWENMAAAVLAEYHKRQIELGRQTKPPQSN